MISDESKELFGYVIRVGYCTKILPFKLEPENNRVNVVKNISAWRLVGLAYFLNPWALIWGMLHGATTSKDAAVEDVIFFVFCLFGGILSSAIHLHTWLRTDDFAALISSVWLFVHRLSTKNYGMDTKGKDGMEWVMKLILTGFTILVPLGGICGMLL